MRIGIIGTGHMADALGGQWAAAGHDVLVGGRDRGRAEVLARRIGHGARAGGVGDAARHGAAVLLAVPYAGVSDALRSAGAASGALAGRALIDCVNPIGPGFTVVSGAWSAAEEVSRAAPGAHVVKAFNLCPDGVWRMRPPVGGGRPLGVPLCGDDAGALTAVRRLVTDIGCVPMDAGPLARAGVLEATAAFVIGMVAAGTDPAAALAPLALAGSPVPQGE